MAYVVEDGTGLTNSTVLCSLEDANTYHATNPRADSVWSTLTDDEKKLALQRATMTVSAAYAGRFKGTLVNSDQALPFPRYGLYDGEGRAIASTVVPTGVKYAIAEVAELEATEDQMAKVDGGSVTSKTVGPLSIDYGAPSHLAVVRGAAGIYLRQFLIGRHLLRA